MKIELKGGWTKVYTVEKTIEIKGSQYKDGRSVTRYTEDLSVTIDKSASSELIAKVVRSNVRKDDKRSCQNPIDHYFIKSSEPLNNLVLKLSANGEIESVLNREETLKKWGHTKIYLDRYFVSDDANVASTISSWTKQLDFMIKDDALFMQSIKRDLLYTRFFHGYWTDYGDTNLSVRNFCFPAIFGNANTVLTEETNVSETKEKHQLTTVGYLDKQASDTNGIAEFLGIEESQIGDLSVSLKSSCLLDDAGLIEKIEMETEAKLSESDFQKRYCLTIK